MAATPRRGTSTDTLPRSPGRRSPLGGRPAAGPPHRPRYPAASSSRHCSRGDTFHVPALPHLRQLEEVLVLDLALRRCTAGIRDAKAYVIVLAINVAVRRRIGSQEPFLCACRGLSPF